MLGQYFIFNGMHSNDFNARMLRFEGGGFINEPVIGGGSIEEQHESDTHGYNTRDYRKVDVRLG